MLEILQTEEFRGWERSLVDQRARAAIAARLFRLANGLRGDVKSIGDGLYEIRIHYGPGFRVYFTHIGERIVLLLCGGDKGRQKMDIARARRVASEFGNKQ